MIRNKCTRLLGTAGCVAILAAASAGAVADGAAADAAAPTQKMIVRPVTSHRQAAPGYRVHTENRSVSCTSTSAGAIDNGIAYCGSSADYTVACWHSSHARRVLCLPDPTKKTLESIRLDGQFPKLRAPAHPQPQALQLDDGHTFLIRDGGAGATLKQHPSWVAAYYRSGRATTAIYGPIHKPINTRHAQWFVTTFSGPESKGERHDVTRAYYVGTGS